MNCAACMDTGAVLAPVPCSDPQCGDSTWDHACDAGYEDRFCACDLGQLKATAAALPELHDERELGAPVG